MENLDLFISSCLSQEAKRGLSVKMYSLGISSALIQEALGVSQQFVSKWNRRYQAGDLTSLSLQYKGKPGYLSEVSKASIIAHLREQDNYSLSTLRDYIATNYGIVFKSKQSYYDLLSAGGLSWHRTQKRNPSKDESLVLAQREEIKKKWHRNPKPLKKGN